MTDNNRYTVVTGTDGDPYIRDSVTNSYAGFITVRRATEDKDELNAGTLHRDELMWMSGSQLATIGIRFLTA